MPAFFSSKRSAADGIQHNCQNSKKGIANLKGPMSRLLPNRRNLHREPGMYMYKGVLMILLNNHRHRPARAVMCECVTALGTNLHTAISGTVAVHSSALLVYDKFR